MTQTPLPAPLYEAKYIKLTQLDGGLKAELCTQQKIMSLRSAGLHSGALRSTYELGKGKRKGHNTAVMKSYRAAIYDVSHKTFQQKRERYPNRSRETVHVAALLRSLHYSYRHTLVVCY